LGVPFVPEALSWEHYEHRYTGRVLGTPTFREGKVTRLVEWIGQTGRTLRDSHFYSDSHNDLPLQELVDIPVAVNPILRAHAEAAEWPLIRLHEKT
jgi:phosphoserine phosphatase